MAQERDVEHLQLLRRHVLHVHAAVPLPAADVSAHDGTLPPLAGCVPIAAQTAPADLGQHKLEFGQTDIHPAVQIAPGRAKLDDII